MTQTELATEEELVREAHENLEFIQDMMKAHDIKHPLLDLDDIETIARFCFAFTRANIDDVLEFLGAFD